jgi:hypothetical protein
MKDHKIEIGSGDRVTIEKLFGPTIFADLRITADYERGCWVIERQWIETGEFIEWCTIPNQIEQEFKEEQP